MSSIYGVHYFDPQRSVDRTLLDTMAAAMSHRGKETAVHVAGATAIGFATPTRDSEPALPRMDLDAAVVDGTLHNLADLAAELRASGVSLSQATPTAVLPALQRTRGLEFPIDLDGFFALATCDPGCRQLTLARDRFGVKPLYYREEKEGVYFASEAKALCAISESRPAINRAGLLEYLTFRSTSGSETMLAGIRELLPGRVISWSGDRRTETRYWSPAGRYAEATGATARDARANLEEIDRLLRASIAKRIRSRERIGANCSGGIDSGLITALTSLVAQRPIETFTVGFRESEWDERKYARYITEKYGARPHEIVVESAQFSELLPKLNWHNDFPLSDPNSVLVYILAGHSRGLADVLLTGEGADEVFLGYPRYNLLKLYGALRSLPRAAREPLRLLLGASGNRRLGKLSEALALPPEDAVIRGGAFVSRQLLQTLAIDAIRPEGDTRHRRLRDTADLPLLPRLMSYEIETYMLSSLNRLDRMSMAAGVEAELPFLDPDLFDFALGIPTAQKITWLDNKTILRKLASRYLPKENMTMPKSGFGVPIAHWLRTDANLKDALSDLQRDPAVSNDFDGAGLSRIIEMHQSEEADFAELLWLLVCYHVWKRQN